MTRILAGVLVLSSVMGAVGCGGDDDDDGAAGAASSCHDGCVATLAADCANGPSSQTQCESDCKALASGSCATKYQALQACAEGKAVTCSAAGLPTVSECTSETSAFVSCLQ